MIQELKTGKGWRIGWNPNAHPFQGLVGSDDWSIEMTAAEFTDFCRGARHLQNTMHAMAEQLMDQERLSCEQETSTIWLEAEGFPEAYSLRFILLTGRRGEGEWTATAAAELLDVLTMPPFNSLAIR